jgi:hypothetical protein
MNKTVQQNKYHLNKHILIIEILQLSKSFQLNKWFLFYLQEFGVKWALDILCQFKIFMKRRKQEEEKERKK